MKICRVFCLLFFRFLNFIPFFHVSCDENFDTIQTQKHLKNIRFSLFNFECGDKIFYFFTSKKDKFSFFYELRLCDLLDSDSDDAFKRDIDKLDQVNSKNYHVLLTYYKEEILSLQSASDSLSNRINILFTAIVAIAPLSYFVIEKFDFSITSIILLTVLAHVFFNLLLHLMEFSNVKSLFITDMSKFQSNINSFGKGLGVLKSYCYNYLGVEKLVRLQASRLRLVRKYFIRILLIGSIIFAYLLINHK